jgi:hypothetical protein
MRSQLLAGLVSSLAMAIAGHGLVGCGGRSLDGPVTRESNADHDSGALDEAPNVPTDSTAASSAPSATPVGCTPLPDPSTAIVDSGLKLNYACGIRRADVNQRSPFVSAGERCAVPFGELNTFAVQLSGANRGLYSAVVRCGYIRYDNGTFVGSRVAVEARDGAWCDDLALQSIDLKDRMLLTDVSFWIEPTVASAPSRGFTYAFTTRAGVSLPIPNRTNVCVYVANRMEGAFTCGLAPPSADCSCLCDPNWGDFLLSMTLSLVAP